MPLSFTDAAAHPRAGLVFSAAAEASDSTYADGPCFGSVIGILVEGRVTWSARVGGSHKIEGIAIAPGPDLSLWLVADPDDRSRCASLHRTQLTAPPGPT